MVAIDAVTKMGHYVNCGTGSVGLEPHLNAFYGDPEIQVKDSFVAGKLNLKSFMQTNAYTSQQPANVDEDDDDQENGHVCDASLSCSRPAKPCKGVL